MRFTPSFLDDIKARVPVSDVVRRKVKLIKSGREWKGLSPFNSEKSPSFFVNDQKMAWFDFSSGRNGNIFDFVMATEGVSFPEAVERLASDAGLALPTVTPETIEREQRRTSLQDVLEFAVQFFEAQLQAPVGAKARGYLADRGLTPAMQRQFRMGYSPNERFALREHLATKGVHVDDMIATGMLIHGEEIAVPYDRFRDRVMFPIMDRAGKPIAFGGRALDKDAQAKYLNSPETPLFHKGSVLYNHHNARKAAHDRGTVVAVEGYVDVVSMTAVGVANVVAPLGTALTPDQCTLLWQMAEEPILCFDGDKAGRKAAWRAIDTALPQIEPGRTLRFAFMPDGQDPDDLARSGGAVALNELLGQARPLVDVLWMRETESVDLNTPERRAALERRLKEVTGEIKDETLRRYYRQDLEARLAALFGPPARRNYQNGAPFVPGRTMGGGRAQMGGRQGGFKGGFMQQGHGLGFVGAPVQASPSMARSSLFSKRLAFSPREGLILLIAVNHPGLLERYAEEIAELDLSSPEMSRMRDCLIGALDRPQVSAEGLYESVKAAGFGELLGKIEQTAALSTHWSLKTDAAENDAEEMLRQALTLHRRARALHKDLKSAEIALGENANEQNLLRLREIQAELTGLEGREAAVEGFGVQSGRITTGV